MRESKYSLSGNTTSSSLCFLLFGFFIVCDICFTCLLCLLPWVSASYLLYLSSSSSSSSSCFFLSHLIHRFFFSPPFLLLITVVSGARVDMKDITEMDAYGYAVSQSFQSTARLLLDAMPPEPKIHLPKGIYSDRKEHQREM